MRLFSVLTFLLLLFGCTSKQSAQLDDGLQTGQLAQSGLDATTIDLLINKLHDKQYQQVHSLLIYKDGLLVVEEYLSGNNDYIEFENHIARNSSRPDVQWHRDKTHYVASVNKALTATLAGIALAQSDTKSSQTMANLLPQYSHFFNDSNKARMTLKDVLNMQLGFQWDEWSNNDLALLWQSSDFTEFVLKRPNEGPGKKWVYNSAGPNMLLKALQNLVKEPLYQWADKHFYQKLGITDYQWQQQPGGLPEGSARMHLRPRDMLKIGITYLNGGKWQGQQVIPKSWIDKVFTPQVDTGQGQYSHMFWHRQLSGIKYISADGDGGQYINIFPAQNMVIVMTQGNYLQWPLYAKQAEDIMSRFIFKAILD